MTDFLVDTSVLLLWDGQDRKLNAAARQALADSSNRVFVSAASVWEIAVKRASGKLRAHGSPSASIADNGFLPLHITPEDAERAGGLDWHHSDPFDRMLVAQAQARNLILVHADAKIGGFKAVSQLWAG